MYLTEEEKKIILAKRREENKKNPKKVGILKHNLYYINYGDAGYKYDLTEFMGEGGFTSKDNVLKIVKEIQDDLLSDTTIYKGTKFESYMVDGFERWTDENGDLCEMDSYWALENLKNIRTIKGKV